MYFAETTFICGFVNIIKEFRLFCHIWLEGYNWFRKDDDPHEVGIIMIF